MGNIRSEQQYEYLKQTLNTISYRHEWKKQSDGMYSREVEVYSANNLDEDSIIKIINEEEASSLDEILGEPTSKRIEIKNNLTEEEIKAKAHLQAIIYSETPDDFIIVKETKSENITTSLLWLFLNITLSFLISAIREKVSSFDFKYCINKINEKYPSISTEELQKKLEIKLNNYNRLMR